MPKHRKSEKKVDTSDSDSGPDDRGPAKKAKPSGGSSSSGGDSEENSWSLGKTRFVKLREFKGNWSVDVREWYDAGGELKPGKKGISLTMEQWQKFKELIPDVDKAIKKNV